MTPSRAGPGVIFCGDQASRWICRYNPRHVQSTGYPPAMTGRQPDCSERPDSRRLRLWLQASGSLTRQLTRCAAGQFRVLPLQQQFGRMSRLEGQRLGVPWHLRVWVREVWLYGHDAEPWVYARTLFPQSVLQGSGRRLRFLGGRALGHQLFARGRQPQARRWVEQTPSGWRRTTRYRLPTGPVLVSETFLPAFLAHLDEMDFEP